MAKQRAYILSHSATSVYKWMGFKGWSLNDAIKVTQALATANVTRGTILTGLNDGKSEKYRTGMAQLTDAEILELEMTRDHVDHGSDDDETDSKEESLEMGVLKAKVDVLLDRLDELEKKTPKKVVIEFKSPKFKLTIEDHVHPIFEEVMFHLNCGDNVMLVGPKGCGKTHIVEQVANVMKRRHAILSLSGGVTEGKILGRVVPNVQTGKSEFHGTPFTDMYENGGVVLLDEVDGGDPNVLLSLNLALSNRKLVLDRTKNPIVNQHDDFLAMAAANTFCNGADRKYVGRNQQDSAFTDRFVQLYMDYDHELEAKLCPNHPDLVKHVHHYRAKVRENKMEREVSMRFLLRAYNWMNHGKGLDYCLNKLFTGWREDEIKKVRVPLPSMNSHLVPGWGN